MTSLPEAPPTGYVGRLAPSPTGRLHLGHARTFLVAWWLARQRSGQLLLRFEDLDHERSLSEYADAACSDLEWLGIDWDGPVTFQSDHLERIREAAAYLERSALAYPCTCSRGDIRAVLSAPHPGEDRDFYPGTCRDLYASIADARARTGKAAGLRFRCPAEHDQIGFEDALMGWHSEESATTAGDFLILRRDGVPAYQLAVVVDDAAQGVNHVVRGCDLLDSTPRQIALQRALALPAVTYCHVPLVLDATGRRLAKRADDLSLAELRTRGVRPEVIVTWAARSLGLDVEETRTAREMLPVFALDRVRMQPTRIDDSLIANWRRN
jgi:glutamyl-tRNA synthetase